MLGAPSSLEIRSAPGAKTMICLKTHYLGLELEHPVVASASPLSGSLEGIRRLAGAGLSAIVLESLFEEQIDLEEHLYDRLLSGTGTSFAEALGYFPERNLRRKLPHEVLRTLEAAAREVDVPLIASLNGVTPGGWLEFARKFEQAGADALELNPYQLATDPRIPGTQLEERMVELVRAVTAEVQIPVAVKLTPFLSSLPNMVRRLAEAGARGVVLFNRFYQADFDLETRESRPRVTLSRSSDLLLPVTWTGILYGRVALDLAISSGVHTAEDVLKGTLAGARVTMMASRLLQDGPEVVPQILQGLRDWLEEHGYTTLGELRGRMSRRTVSDPAALERANYMQTLHSRDE